MKTIKINDLQKIDDLTIDDYIVIETSEGTRRISFEAFKSLFNTKDETTKLVIDNFIADKSSPQIINTTVTFTAKVYNNDNILQYRFYRYLNDSYALLKDWSVSNVIEFTPNIAGTYDIWVEAKDDYGNVAKSNVIFSFEKQLLISSFTADKISPQVSGETIILTALAVGNGSLQYRFRVSDGKGNFATIKDYSSSNTATWTTKATGNKILYVDVKDSTGQEISKTMNYTISEPPIAFAINSFIASPTSITSGVNTDITFNWTYSIVNPTGISSILINDITIPNNMTTYKTSINLTANKTYTLKIIKNNVTYTKALTISVKAPMDIYYYGSIKDLDSLTETVLLNMSKKESNNKKIECEVSCIEDGYVIFALPKYIADSYGTQLALEKAIYMGIFAGGMTKLKDMNINNIPYTIMRSEYAQSESIIPISIK